MFLDDILGVLKFFRNPTRIVFNLADLLDTFDKSKTVDFDKPYREQPKFYRWGGTYSNVPEPNVLATWTFPWLRKPVKKSHG